MNKKVKKNLVLIVTLASTGLVAVGLLIYVLILFINWSEYRARTEAARNEVKALISKETAPGKENEERIKKDIALYEAKSRDMVDTFKSPLRPAVDAFLQELPPPKKNVLSDEEKEFYKQEGTGIEGDEETKAVPLKIRKLSYDDFRKFFNDRFEVFCQQRNISEDKDRLSLMTLSLFRSECVNLFPQGSWKRAMDKFVEVAKPLVYETINEADPLPLLLVGFGMPRRVSDNITLLERQIDATVSRKIEPIAKENNLIFGDDALKFIGGGSETKGLAVSDYPMAFFHWDVFGDIVKRLCNAKATSLQKVVVRTYASEGEEGGTPGGSAINLNASFEQDGNFRLYHYTVVFTGSMSAVRNVLREFDMAWKERRMYLVRGVALYAGDNGAAVVMKQLGNGNQEQKAENTAPTSRRRRRRAEAAEEQEQKTETVMSEKELREGHYRVILKRKQQEAANNSAEGKKVADEILNDSEVNEYLNLRQSADQGSHSAEKATEFFSRLEKKLAPHERYGYGKVLVGGEANKECTAYLDIDYVVVAQEQ